METYSEYSLVSGFLHVAQDLRFVHIVSSINSFFLCVGSILWYECFTISLPVHLLMNILRVFNYKAAMHIW